MTLTPYHSATTVCGEREINTLLNCIIDKTRMFVLQNR